MHNLKMSNIVEVQAGIAGHNGVGHAISHSGFLQDDSYGFAMLANLLAKAGNFELIITAILCSSTSIHIEIGKENIGIGEASTSEHITQFEKILLQKAVGESALIPQSLTTKLLGRTINVNETALAFNLALSRAILDFFKKNWPQTEYMLDNVPNSCGAFLGGCLLINTIPFAWLLTINASDFSGPNEDSEGTIPIGNKGLVMQKIGMFNLPTIILESKAFVPALQERVDMIKYYVRWNEEYDNSTVAQALINALQCLDIPYFFEEKAYARDETLVNERKRIGYEIEQLGKTYADANTSAQKVEIAYRLGKLVTQDIGGSLFMSDAIYKYSSSGGAWPGCSAVLSLIADKKHIEEYGTVYSTEEELEQSTSIIIHALLNLEKSKIQAHAEVKQKGINLSPQDTLNLVL